MNVRRWPVLARIDVPLAIFIVVAVAFQLWLYSVCTVVPAHHPLRGWEGWWDQSLYLKSARAFAAFDLSEAQHWYPIGYALFAAPFVRIFDDPFFVPNLVSLIVFAWAFQRYFRPLIGMTGVAIAFFGALVLPVMTLVPAAVKHILWLQFVVPWNSVPVAALFMSLLCLVNELQADDALSKDFLIGALVGAVAAIKPAELLPVTVLGLAYLTVTLHKRTAAWRRIGMAALGGIAVAGPVLALSLYIHHGLSSPYTDLVGHVGMSLSDLPQRAVDLFIDAGPSFGEPYTALFGLLPWFAILAPLALVGAVLRPRELLVPVALVAASFLTYLAYNDFTPKSLLHYFLIHYVVWTLPVIAASGLYMAVSVVRRPRWAIPSVVAIIVFCIIGAVRVELKPATPSHVDSREADGGHAFDLEFAAATHLDAIDLPATKAMEKVPLWDNPLKVEVDRESLKLFYGYRLIHLSDRWRLIFTRPVDATRVSFWLPGIDTGQAVDIRPIRFGLRFASSPWASHSSDLNVIAEK